MKIAAMPWPAFGSTWPMRVLALMGSISGIALAAPADEPAELPKVEIVSTTPLPGLGTPLRDVPANIQLFRGRELERQRQGNLAEFLENNPTSVSVNAAQGNPYQLDVSFRGFTASPLVGVPQGLSVFQDGVRINEAFGDVVNWDLLPQSAISSIQLIPGSNPVFGLNTLGGALSIDTKSGTSDPGTALEVSGGSFGRQTAQLEHGGAAGPWDWFATLNLSKDKGWAEHNPSRVQQLFGKLGYHTEPSDIELTLTAADNRLEGTQTLPQSFLDDRRQAYTYPDVNRNELAMLALKGSHRVSGQLQFGGNLYLRRYRNRNLSSNVNDHYGEVDPATGAVDGVQAINDQSDIDQTSYGIGAQLTLSHPLLGHANDWVIGASGDLGDAIYTREAQPAEFTASRGATAIGAFAPDTDAKTHTRNFSLYTLDTFHLTPQWTLTASGRYNDAQVSIRDRSGVAPALDGDHAFRRFNPALGLNFNPTATLTAYASYNEGMRAPTALELTCADPEAPCKLPNSFLADPPLKKIVAKTIEIGTRGRLADFRWSAALYRTDLFDDIQFVSSGGAINAGYFQNVGKTRREGLELTAGSTWGTLTAMLRYSLIDARFLTGFVEHSPANSSADANGDIAVQAGDRLPSVPRQSLRARIDWQATPSLSLGANLLASAASRLRGDENNRDAHGAVPGYGLVNLDGRYAVSKELELFARINNLLNRDYANFGVLGQNTFAGPTRSFDPSSPVNEAFLGLGAPRGVWIGARYVWE